MPRLPRHDVVLVPGFFGFANLGQITYFGHVKRMLASRFEALGFAARIHVVRSPPTASLPVRAARIAETVRAIRDRPDGPIHLIGHSSGGLDARLLAAPGSVLPTRADVARIAARVRSIVTVATPHRGTPLASTFATLRGQRLLQLLSVGTISVLHYGRLPIAALLRAGGMLTRLDDLALNSDILDEVFRNLLTQFSVGRRRAVRRLLREIVSDQALLVQLTPEAMEVFAASVHEREGVRCGSVVTRAARPGLRSTLAAGLDPGAQVSHVVHGVLHRLTRAIPRGHVPRLSAAHRAALRRAYGALPPIGANDGIVPTRSQVWAQVIHATEGDHLDVLGHFRDAEASPPHVDWLSTGSGFDRQRFEALWSDVARFVAAGD